MEIKIASRFKPFSHTPGTSCLIPGTFWKVLAYPTKFIFQNIESDRQCVLDLKIAGPIQNFTCQQDLEKGKVYIFGQEKRGYFRFEIFAANTGVEIRLDKCVASGISLLMDGKEEKTLYSHDRMPLAICRENVLSFSKDFERLSLGSHKKQDWDLVTRRKDIREILPIWLKLGLYFPKKIPPKLHPLLKECETLIKDKNRVDIGQAFINLFQTRFAGIMCPLRENQNHLGICDSSSFTFSPFILLQKGASCIRSLFFTQKDDCMYILPCLPKSLVSGRYINIQCDEIGFLDMQWSKGKIRKMVLRSTADKKILLYLQKSIKSFRVCEKENEKGKAYSAHDPIQINCGKSYIFDRFQK